MTSPEAVAAAGMALAKARARRDSLDPRAAAEAAWHPGAHLDVDALEDLIRAQRGLTPLDRARPVSGGPLSAHGAGAPAA